MLTYSFKTIAASETAEACTSVCICSGEGFFLYQTQDEQSLNKTSNACESTAGHWSPQTGSFPKSTNARHADFPSECDLYRNRCVCERVCVFGRWGWKNKHLRVEGHAAGQAAAPDWPIAVKKSPPPLTVGLVTHAQDDLRGAVVACDYIRCHEEAGGGGPGQTKIQDL